MPDAVLVAAGLAGAAVGVLLLPGPGRGRVRALELRGEAGGRARVGRERRAPPPAGLVAAAAALGATALGAALSGGAAAALAALAVVVGHRWRAGRARAGACEAERVGAVEACAAFAAELRAGRSPAQALEVAAGVARGPSGQALAAAAATARLGGDVPAALAPTGDRGAVPDVLRSLSACWTVCAGSGSGLAAAVERLEQGLRAERDQRRAVQAELAGPRATAAMLAVLPLGGLVLAAGLGADPAQVLLHTPVGLVCLTAGLGLDALGWAWTSRLVARAGGGA